MALPCVTRRSGMRLLLASLLLIPSVALASDTNYQNFITGGRAVGLGGAFTALSDDPSGMYYNPAGLVDDDHTDVSVSANLYGFERTARGNTVPSPFPDLTNIGKTASELVIIPSTTGFVRTFQKDPERPGYLNALAAGVLVPSFSQSVESIRSSDPSGAVDYKRNVNDRVLMPGLGYARKLGERWRVGISTFLVVRTLEANEKIVSSGAGDPTPFRYADSTLSLSAASLLWVLGVKCLVSDRFSLGLSFAPPSLPVFSSTSLRYYRGQFDPAVQDGTNFLPIVEDALPSTYVTPATLRFGGAYKLPRAVTFAMDLSLHFPVSYDLITAPQARKNELARILPIAAHVERLAVVNINVGAEWMFIKNMSVSAGFYTDFASSPTLNVAQFAGPLQRQELANIDYYGFTAALGFFSQYTLTRIGALYAFGTGQDVATRDDFGRLLENDPQFTRVQQAKSLLYIFVSSTVRFE